MFDIDLALLNLAERLCRRFQLLTGRTSVWLAFQLTNLSIVVYFVWAGVYFFISEGLPRIALAMFCTAVLYLLSQTIFKSGVEAYESDAYRRVAKGLRNPRRLRDAPLRIAFLTLSVVMFWPIFIVYLNIQWIAAYLSFLMYASVLLGYSLIVLTTVVLYLLACDPLPPCPDRVAAWLRTLIPVRLAGSESPAGD